MRRCIRWVVVPVGIALALLVTSCSIPLADLGGPSSVAYGINEAGVIVGSSELPGSTPEHRIEHATKRLPDGTVIDLGGLPGGGGSAAFSINEAGTVAGLADVTVPGSDPVAIETHVVRWDSSGAVTDLGVMGGVRAVLRDLDHQGRIVGWVENAAGRSKAFVADAGADHLTQLDDLPGGGDSIALGMNESGDVVGYQWVGFLPVPVRWDADTRAATDLMAVWGRGLITDINDAGTMIGLARFEAPTGATTESAVLRPGDPAPISLGIGSFGFPLSINDADVIAGYRSAAPAPRAFRWEASTGAVLLDPDVASYAYDINDHGQIVGQSSDRAALFFVPPQP